MSIYEEIKGKLEELHNKISPENVKEWHEDAKKIFKLFIAGEELRDFRKVVECVHQDLQREVKKEVNKEKKEQLEKYRNRVYGLLSTLQSREPDFLIERLKGKGWKIAQDDKDFCEALQGQIYRLLEKTRLGKRDVVINMLMRLFTSFGKQFPQDLIEAIKPQYENALFKAFIYAFLSGFTTKSKEEETNE